MDGWMNGDVANVMSLVSIDWRKHKHYEC